MSTTRFLLLVLLIALACAIWLGCLVLDRVLPPSAPPNPLVEEALPVIEAWYRLDDHLHGQEKPLASGSPECAALRLRRDENHAWMIEQLKEIHRKHGRTYAAPSTGRLDR
jgi:hypothetical protein